VGKNVAVFVDVANIFYAAKAAGVDIDYVTLLKSATAGRDFVRAYAYTGLDPDNENQKNFHSFLARHGFRVVSKDIRKYGDGKVKANLDIELVVDLMKTARNLDVAVVVSGDGDFAPAIRAVQEMGVRVEVISFRGNTSSDLMEVADQFTDIGQIARVDKTSTRSGRRVADDDEDLSMTEVPEKQSEGRGEARRGRGDRDRGRGRGRDRDRDRDQGEAAVVAATGRSPLVALPGERLSKAADDVEDEEAAAELTPQAAAGDEAEAGGEEGRRRRRRRGGRGRGRGRGREEGLPAVEAGEDVELTPFDEPELPVPSRAPRTKPFGSVWDTQLGTPAARPGADLEPFDDEDLEEPAIPEYLLAERRGGRGGRQGQGGQGGRGGRGRSGGYAAAIDRERYGSRGGINRYGEPRGGMPAAPRPDRRPPRPERGDRPDRQDRGDRERDRSRSAEPWQEVPPELEQLIRQQVARSGGEPRREDRAPAADQEPQASIATPADDAQPAPGTTAAATETATDQAPARTRRRGGRAGVEPEAAVTTAGPIQPGADADAPAPRTRRRTTPAAAGKAEPVAAPEGSAEGSGASETTPAAPRPRTTRRVAAAAAEAPPLAAEPEPEAAPVRRRTTRRAATPDPGAEAGEGPTAAAEPAAPRRRTRRVAPDEGAGA